jgi:hypothetical protein
MEKGSDKYVQAKDAQRLDDEVDRRGTAVLRRSKV